MPGLMDSAKEVFRSAAGMNEERDLKEAFGLMNKQIQRDEMQAEVDYYKQNKSGAKAGEIQPYKGPTDLERWKKQISMLLNSENPTLQKKGVEMLGGYNARATQKDNITNFNLNDRYVKPGDDVFDKDGMPVRLPAGTTYDDLAARQGDDQVFFTGQRPTNEEGSQTATVKQSLENLERLRDLVAKNEGNVYGIEGWMNKVRSKEGLPNAVFNSVMEAIDGPVTPAAVEMISLTTSLSNTLLDAMRGAQVGPKEQGIFNLQLPMPGMPKGQFIQNMVLTYTNLRNIAEGKVTARGTWKPGFLMNPKDFEQFQIDGDHYRILPGGRLQVGKEKEE